jgi:hypothetical protein
MPTATTSQQKITFAGHPLKSMRRPRATAWWGPVWRGLFVDPAGKHYRAMGRALWLYGYLIVHADRKAGTLYRAIATIASDMYVSARTIQAWLAILRRHNYIRTTTTGRALKITIERWKPAQKLNQDAVSGGASFPLGPLAAPQADRGLSRTVRPTNLRGF